MLGFDLLLLFVSQNCFDLGLSLVTCPVCRSSLPENISQVGPRSMPQKQLHHIQMPRRRRLVKRRGMRMATWGVVSVGSLPCHQQQAHDLCPSILCRQRKGEVSIVRTGRGDETLAFLQPAQGCGHG